ncbi:DcuS/MalK family sensor histidine kinase [Anaeroselena agilis]|uniref:histidine kinase n=1 Tax=Anaeroselena agilis TaxID=3063788 RepID=A0ABU3NWM8_9FIRM|nr:DcuS/MalK family sensor histidine kinase [Selenomonadales bacterium 4137-cl]
MRTGKPYLNLQTKIAILVCGVVALALLVTNILITRHIAATVEAGIGENAADIARIMARSPLVIASLEGGPGTPDIRAFAKRIRKATNVEFIVVMDMNGIRKTHPNPTIIGQHFVGGDEVAVLKEGREYTSVAKGTLGLSLRAFTPVFAADGRQIGAVAVGILLHDIEREIDRARSIIYLAVGVGLLVGVIGALALAANIKKTMFGLEPFAIARLVEERNATLQSVREGIIAVDKEARITVVNDEAKRILSKAGLDVDLIGRKVTERIANTRLQEVLESGRVELDQVQNINGVEILTNRMPIKVDGQVVGAIATFRDKTEIRLLAEQLTGIRAYAEALRAQTHEFMNKLHVILGMVKMECYDQLAAYINSIAQARRTETGFVTAQIRDPVLAGFLLGKLSRARELGAELVLEPSSCLPAPADPETVHELITIIGNLVDNALDAVANANRKRVALQIAYEGGELTIAVTDSGPGIDPGVSDAVFAKGFSTKADDRGLGLYLVKCSLDRLGGRVSLAAGDDGGARFTITIPYHPVEGTV